MSHPNPSPPGNDLGTVTVQVNGETQQLPAGTTVTTMLERLGHDPRGLAVAVDADVVPRSAWAATALIDGASVEILAAAQGG